MMEACVEDLGCADDGHVLIEDLVPELLARDFIDHLAADFLNTVVQVAGQNGMLLEDKSNLVDKEEGNAFWESLGPVL